MSRWQQPDHIFRMPIAVLAIFTASIACRGAESKDSSPPAVASSATRGEPDYTEWDRLLSSYVDPASGVDYRGLKAKEAANLARQRSAFARVDPSSLTKDEQLAYWINLYNLNVIGTIVDHYPITSIRDLSTDLIKRLNVFDQENVPFGTGFVSLNWIENEKIREGFRDPRIHFAINCAAKSCPPVRTEAYRGASLNEQLDDQTRKFLTGPSGAVVTRSGNQVTIETTKIMDWFGKDFDDWGGGRVAFLRKYLGDDTAKALDTAGTDVSLKYRDYSWDLNDWKR